MTNSTKTRTLASRLWNTITMTVMVAAIGFLAPIATYQVGQVLVSAIEGHEQPGQVQAQLLDTALLSAKDCSFTSSKVCIIQVAADQDRPLGKRRFQVLRLTGVKNGEASFTTRTVSLKKALAVAAQELDREAASSN